MYADDATLINKSNNLVDIQAIVEETQNSAEHWYNNNMLKLNRDKTQKQIFSTNNAIVNGDSVKLLGIVLDDNLKWDAHIEHISNKISSYIFLLRQLKKYINVKTLLSAYYALIQSHITYGVVLWGNSTHYYKIFILQKRAIRIIAGANYQDHCKPLFLKFGIMPLPCLYVYYSVLEIHKHKNTFSTHSDCHSYETRSSNLLKVPRYRLTKSARNSLDLRLYNIIPDNIRKLDYNRFKAIMKSHLLKYCFYSVGEYMNNSVEN